MGYGDITPSNWRAQVVIMIMIIVAVIVVPMQLGRVVDRCDPLLFTMMECTRLAWNRYGGSFSQTTPHVVVMGDVRFESIKEFLQVRAS